MDYNDYRREFFAGVQHIGRAFQSFAQAERGMSARQLKHRRAQNMMTDEKWQYRSLAGGALTVEISYGWFLKGPLFGVTVYCVGELRHDADEWDHALSGVFNDLPSLFGRLHELDLGGRDRIAALVSQAA